MSTPTSYPNAAAVVTTTSMQNDNTSSKELISMTIKELRVELDNRGITLKKSANKDEIFESLGIPSKQWKKWRKMKVVELKVELKKRGLPIGKGRKNVLLQRLGVPDGFGETASDKYTRELNEQYKQILGNTLPEKELLARKKNRINPENDPTHEEYTVDCCDNPICGSTSRNIEPAGCINWPDGSVSEVWRCLNCGEIPKYPNKPLIHEFSDY